MPPSPHAQKPSVHSQLFVALLILPGMAWAQESLRWAEYNRFVELAAGQHQQNYSEQDLSGQTADGIFNSETGNQNAVSASLRWQTENYWLVHLQANRQSGVTRYNGYLQSSTGSLTPYRAHTGNTATQLSATVGYAPMAAPFG